MKRILLLIFVLSTFSFYVFAQNTFTIDGNRTLLNGADFQAIGLRCSNALISEEATSKLIDHLDLYQSYGLNTISVFFMGSRYSNINGFNLDGSLNQEYAQRMARIIEACDQRKMVVLVGILYWGAQQHGLENAFYASWEQKQVNLAMQNTIKWLNKNNYKNVFIDPDNEGMAERGAGFDVAEMICSGKAIDPNMVIAYNGKGYPPPCADMPIHFGKQVDNLPYIQTEGTPGHYWGDYSKEKGLNEYINVGIYTKGKKREQLKATERHLVNSDGYLFASTWLQNVPPNFSPGGDGSACNPGMLWWMEFVQEWVQKSK